MACVLMYCLSIATGCPVVLRGDSRGRVGAHLVEESDESTRAVH